MNVKTMTTNELRIARGQTRMAMRPPRKPDARNAAATLRAIEAELRTRTDWPGASA
jgi:hypothetical protein